MTSTTASLSKRSDETAPHGVRVRFITSHLQGLGSPRGVASVFVQPYVVRYKPLRNHAKAVQEPIVPRFDWGVQESATNRLRSRVSTTTRKPKKR